MMIQRLSFQETEAYSALEAAIHLCRYSMAQQLCAGKRVLDISCGEGYGSSFMATRWGAAEVHGVDIAEDAIARAREAFADPRITFHCRPAEDLEQMFAAGSFDLVVCLETMEHVPDARALLTTLRKLLKPNGALLLSCPNDWWYYPEEGKGNPWHVRKFTHAEFLALTRETLGPPAQLLFGVPATGFANIAIDAPQLRTGAGDPTPKGMFGVTPLPNAAGLPADDTITAQNCSYFVGVWGATVAPASFTVFPCSMDRSSLAREQQAMTNLRAEVAMLRNQADDVRRLERALRDAQLMASAWRAECEYIRMVATSLRGAPPAPPVTRRMMDIARAVKNRLRRLVIGR